MSYPVTSLISESYYTSGIVSRGFQTVAGDQVEVGLLKLNEILSDTAIEDNLVPYFDTAYDFYAVPGQEMYFIPGLSQLETLAFFIDTVRYQMRKNSQDKYFGQGRAQNVESLPFNWHAERCFGGTNIFIYFFPDRQYPMQATGRFRLNNVLISQDLSSPAATANLGAILAPTLPATLIAGQFVVNNIDLAGTYASTTAFITYINTGVIPGVTAALVNGEFILTATQGISINLITSGAGAVNGTISFVNFATNGLNTIIPNPQIGGIGGGALNQTFMPMVLDQYYINFLQYKLANLLCIAYNFTTPQNLMDKLKHYEQMISKKSSPMDLSIGKISTLGKLDFINYGQVNLGHGWTTT
jgi:hypothetical protein